MTMPNKQPKSPSEWADVFIQHARTSDDTRDVECGSFAANLVADHIERVRSENKRMRELLEWAEILLIRYPSAQHQIESFLAERP